MDSSDITTTDFLDPPVISEDHQAQNWFAVPADDRVARHLTTLWDQKTAPGGWLAARLSPAAFVYREQTSGWKALVKFYVRKTGNQAGHYAEREFQITQRAWEYLPSGLERSVRPLGSWKGTLILEFVDGLTLEDKIAIRRSQPGKLFKALEATARLLSKLHAGSISQDIKPDFGVATNYANKIVDNLVKHGMLQNQPIASNAIRHLIDTWSQEQAMWDYPPVLNHGDATSSNFVFPAEGGVIAIDWERSDFADPAADLGRLVAEITNSINQHGGNFSEGQILAEELGNVYGSFLPDTWDVESLLQRSRFYRAVSTLRIARNGWLSRQARLGLVLQAFALLSK